MARCSGDVDVWVDAEEQAVYQYVKKKFSEEKEMRGWPDEKLLVEPDERRERLLGKTYLKEAI